MTLMDGKSLRDELLQKYKEKIEKESLAIRLDIITVGFESLQRTFRNFQIDTLVSAD